MAGRPTVQQQRLSFDQLSEHLKAKVERWRAKAAELSEPHVTFSALRIGFWRYLDLLGQPDYDAAILDGYARYCWLHPQSARLKVEEYAQDLAQYIAEIRPNNVTRQK